MHRRQLILSGLAATAGASLPAAVEHLFRGLGVGRRRSAVAVRQRDGLGGRSEPASGLRRGVYNPHDRAAAPQAGCQRAQGAGQRGRRG